MTFRAAARSAPANRSPEANRPGNATSVGDHEVDAAMDAVNSGLLAIGGLDDTRLCKGEIVQLFSDVVTARRRFDAVYLGLVALIDRLGAAGESGLGVQSTEGLLKSLVGLAPGRAKADVAAARAVHGDEGSGTAGLTSVPTGSKAPLHGLGKLLVDGRISMNHVDTAVRTLAKLPTEILEASMAPGAECDEGGPPADRDESEKFEPVTVRQSIADYFASTAPTTSTDDMRHLAKHLIQVLDPDTDDHFDPDSFNRRSMTMSTDITGMVFGTYQLDPVAGAQLRAILDPLSAPRPMQCDENGNVAVRDCRTAVQRRADGLLELVGAASGLGTGVVGAGTSVGRPSAQSSARTRDAASVQDAVEKLFGLVGEPDGSVHAGKAAKLRSGHRPARVTVVTTPEKLSGADPTPSHCFQIGRIRPGALKRLQCDATAERLIMDAKGAVLDLGVGVRLATPRQKRAIAARDMGCVFPGCNRPPSWCDAHHVLWFSRGGPTNVDNLCLLCPTHHTLVHTGQWEVTMICGVPYVRPGPEVRAVKVRGLVARSYGTRSRDGHWVRNSYFDRLKDAESFARDIVASASDPGNPLGRAGLRPR
ncbi:hypothetical protein BJY26_001688 [Spelaeicoccus albus]|uniref:HNH nuclease domain-containing protein n=2 Tax=Spelaeicoccus albus TaxID=1280376 RepID=A0A7Z0AAP4_9MICO|nr:hypothetical protein [Spelaeicoccus albus]